MRLATIAGLAFAAAGLDGVESRAATPEGPLVSTEWLAANLNDPKVRVIEVSVQPGVFERGHIPGATNVRWHSDLVDPVRRDIASKEAFETLASTHGVTPDSTIILYGDNNNWFAAWGAWVFKHYGVDNVRLLDGGRKKWEAEKRELSSRPASVTPGSFKVTTVRPELRARLADVLEAVDGKRDARLVDIRSKDEYEGRIFAPNGVPELAIRAGHIPTAANVPWVKAVQEDGTFKSKEELRKLYADAGIDGSKPVIVYCRIGERSAHTWFALSQILGYETRQYDGSWTEYGNAVGVPITNLAGTVWTGK
ncbi:thiosulfate sulfurtransferase [Oceanibaculum pacificum]|uniref:Thiosulfate sulfurtransferase n=1 Tax=Oceanibaculum pacificum TaxID=580166 RepID=A0A154W1J3_9PROT|nr:thiosulfate sulfurtransferase [Oceanibaculum pacificum]